MCSNNYEVVKVLLDGGADVYVLDHLGRTPIHVATAWGYPRVLALLLSHSKQHLINHQVFIPSVARLPTSSFESVCLCILGIYSTNQH